MAQPRMKFANLDENSLEKLHRYEEAMGTVILAVQPHYPFADLSEEQVHRIKQLEQDLGVILLAYNS